jgi:hypothetical protein
MVLLLLPCGRLVAVETVHTLAGVHAHLILMNDGELCPQVTFGTLSRSPNQVRRRLLCLYFRPRTIQQKRSDDQSESDNDGDKYRTERHINPA